MSSSTRPSHSIELRALRAAPRYSAEHLRLLAAYMTAIAETAEAGAVIDSRTLNQLVFAFDLPYPVTNQLGRRFKRALVEKYSRAGRCNLACLIGEVRPFRESWEKRSHDRQLSVLCALQPGSKRVHVHGSRRRIVDSDLYVLECWVADTGTIGIEEWLFRRADMRMRYSPRALRRLHWLAGWLRARTEGLDFKEPFPEDEQLVADRPLADLE